MKRVGIMVAVALVVAVLLVVVARQPSEAQQPPAGGAAFQQMRVLDTYWVLLAFELKYDNATLDKAKPALQKAYDKRKEVQKAMQAGDREAINKLANLKQEIDNELKPALGDEKFAALQKAYDAQPRMGRPGGGGGGGGAAGGGAAGR